MASKSDNKLLFCATEDPKNKIRSHSSKRCIRSYILSEDYSAATNFHKGFAKILLGIPMDLILNFFRKRADNLWCITF